jgi:hypothetical protein
MYVSLAISTAPESVQVAVLGTVFTYYSQIIPPISSRSPLPVYPGRPKMLPTMIEQRLQVLTKGCKNLRLTESNFKPLDPGSGALSA